MTLRNGTQGLREVLSAQPRLAAVYELSVSAVVNYIFNSWLAESID